MSKKNRTRTYPHKDVTICLDGAAAAERDALMVKVGKGRRSPEVAKQIRDLEDRLRESLLTIRVTGVPRAEYDKIQRAHPGKTAVQAFNPDTFFTDFVYKTGFEVDGDEITRLSEWDRHEWDEIADGLTDAEFTAVATAVHEMNVQRVETGFLSRGSVQTEPSSQNSEQPESGE
jgi:hypothetical protein